MSPIGSENFYRLEEFPSFISCIKCFGRPIFPPLLTPSRRQELKQLRTAAVNKEAEKLRIKKELLNCQKQDIDKPTKASKDDYRSGFRSTIQESCALWFPSGKDCQEGVSVAISKLPTSGIYSSVHNGAIVCSNVIESNHSYTTTIMRDSLLGSGVSVIDCQECSHNNMNLDCSLCQAEYIQSFHTKDFTSEISPEVPCRTFSLPQQNNEVVNDDLNYSVEETECESLPTIICNQKYVPPDTDSDSNITSMTQSTDLEKYMEFSCGFNSPDNSVAIWDSKSSSQQYTLSRSDDASSETIVNTENELTPCASTMAELTDNIEDELSNADETAAVSDKEMISGTLKRAHSVDSYMKILQTCAKSMNVKKSLSEPFNTDLKTASGIEEAKAPLSFKTNLLIKEDSKESDESKEIPEKDFSDQETNKEILSKDEKNPDKKSNNSFQKRHIRQNSYTLDEPSTALILAHADCTCNFDAKCLSPHCSALKDENEIVSNFAFTKEKAEMDIPMSHQQIKKLTVLNSVNSSENVILNKEDTTSTVIDVFPVVREDKCEKYDSGNAQISERVTLPESEAARSKDTKAEDKEHDMISENSKSLDKNQEYFQQIYKELRESHEIRIKELFEEQNKQWLRLQEEFKEQEKFLYEKFDLTIPGLLPEVEETSGKDNDCCSNEKIAENISSHGEVLSISNSSAFSPDQNPTSLQNSSLPVSKDNFQSSYSPAKDLSIPHNARASISPSRESNISSSPSKSLESIKSNQLFKDLDSSVTCNFKNKDCGSSHDSESFQNVNGFSYTTTPFLLSQCNSPPSAVVVTSSEKYDMCFCDNSVKQCSCCTSFNDYCEFSVSTSSGYTPTSQEQNSVSHAKVLDNNRNFPHPHTSSVTAVQGQNLNPENFVNCCSDKSPKNILSNSSKKSNGYISMTQNVISPVHNDKVLSSVVNQVNRNILPQLLKEKSKLPVGGTVSLSNKSLKNGSLSQVGTVNERMIDPDLLKKFEKLPAFVKGYLTRRLLKSDRVQSLINTLQDTAFLIGNLDEDLSTKGDSVSERDVDLRRQLIVQLITTFHNIYDILCNVSIKEKMAIIAESRNLRLKQKVLEKKQESSLSVTTKAPEPAPSKKLTSATLKALERKRRSAFGSRTYTIEDFKNARSRSTLEMRTYTIDGSENFKGRSHSSMSSKNLSISPTSIYKHSVGMGLKRKTASTKSSGSRRSLHNKWVP